MAAIWRGAASSAPRSLTGSAPPYAADPQLPTLLADPDFGKEVTEAQDAWRDVLDAVNNGIPVPGFSAALAYYDALRAERLPAALVQGLRDFSGAHTYRRTDAEAASTRCGRRTTALKSAGDPPGPPPAAAGCGCRVNRAIVAANSF